MLEWFQRSYERKFGGIKYGYKNDEILYFFFVSYELFSTKILLNKINNVRVENNKKKKISLRYKQTTTNNKKKEKKESWLTSFLYLILSKCSKVKISLFFPIFLNLGVILFYYIFKNGCRYLNGSGSIVLGSHLVSIFPSLCLQVESSLLPTPTN